VGGLKNRWATTKGLYIRLLAKTLDPHYAGAILEIMESVERREDWMEAMKEAGALHTVQLALDELSTGHQFSARIVHLERKWGLRLVRTAEGTWGFQSSSSSPMPAPSTSAPDHRRPAETAYPRRGAMRRFPPFAGLHGTAGADPMPSFATSRAGSQGDQKAVIRVRLWSYWRTGSCQFVEKRLCFFQIGGVEALGEPAVDRRQQIDGHVALVSLGQHSRQRPRRAQCQ
jgi:hypothetical protein